MAQIPGKPAPDADDDDDALPDIGAIVTRRVAEQAQTRKPIAAVQAFFDKMAGEQVVISHNPSAAEGKGAFKVTLPITSLEELDRKMQQAGFAAGEWRSFNPNRDTGRWLVPERVVLGWICGGSVGAGQGGSIEREIARKLLEKHKLNTTVTLRGGIIQFDGVPAATDVGLVFGGNKKDVAQQALITLEIPLSRVGQLLKAQKPPAPPGRA